MEETSQEVQIDSTGLVPPKRKRGRPRKTHLSYPGDDNLAPQRLEEKKRTRRKKIDSSLSSITDNAFVGQAVHGVLDGSFDAGYLLTVRVGDTDTVLRGVVFEPGSSVPISKANDIAPSVKMTKRDENVHPSSELPLSTQNASTVAMPSTPASLLPAPAPIMLAQETSVFIPEQSVPPVEAASEQPSVVSLQPNGSPPISAPHHSSQVNQGPAPKLAESVSQLQQHISSPAKTVSDLRHPITSPAEPDSHIRQTIVTPAMPVSHTQQPVPIPAEPASQQLQPMPTAESASHLQQPIPCVESVSQPQRPITHPTEPVGLQANPDT